jgi:hypothetical protein
MRFRVVLQRKVVYEKVVTVEADDVIAAMKLAEQDPEEGLFSGSIHGTGYAVKSIDEVKEGTGL